MRSCLLTLALTLLLGLVLGLGVVADADAATPDMGTKPSTPFAEPNTYEAPGALTGFAYGGANPNELPWGAPKARLTIDVVDVDGNWIASTATSNDGAYGIAGLAEGTYDVTATEEESGATVTYTVDIGSGAQTRLNFIVDERRTNRLVASPAAFLIRDGAHSPDAYPDGRVDLKDLRFVRDNQRRHDGTRRDDDADLNDDGRIDDQDLAIVRQSFGRAVLRSATMFSATVNPGGSACEIEGEVITSLDGHTVGTLSATSGDTVRFDVSQDTGLASSALTGTINFDENPATPSWIEFDLTTGRITGGQVGLLLSGGIFAEPSAALGSVADGYIAFAPDGFENYRLVGITGSLEFAGTAVAYSCDEGNDRKKDVACGTTAAGAGDAACDLGGTKCSSLGASCAKGGACGFCHQATASGVWIDPVTGEITQGTKCTGCSCF